MAMKVAIVGLSPTSHDLAPFGSTDWELWGLPWDRESWSQYNRLFEMHDPSEFYMTGDVAEYVERLNECPILYMQEKHADISPSVKYPFDDVAQTIGCAYWSSSIGYAMALAIHEGAQEIAVYGVDMAGDDEYAYQRPNMEYLIGFARARGVHVHIPDSSSLCQFKFAHYKTRYGEI